MDYFCNAQSQMLPSTHGAGGGGGGQSTSGGGMMQQQHHYTLLLASSGGDVCASVDDATSVDLYCVRTIHALLDGDIGKLMFMSDTALSVELCRVVYR